MTETITKITRATLPDVLTTLFAYATPAALALEAQLRRAADEGGIEDRHEALNRVHHYNAVKEWVQENIADAAKIVLASIYVSGGSFVAQVVERKEEGDESDDASTESGDSAEEGSEVEVGGSAAGEETS